jgi:putative flippase GtrA
MLSPERFRRHFPRFSEVLGERLVLLTKAMRFALVGVVNTVVDAFLFFLAYTYLTASPGGIAAVARTVAICQCGKPANVALIGANVFSWLLAISGSYVMNSFFTFAAESEGKLTLRRWATFASSAILGVIASTTTLVIAAQVMPVWAAKGCAILVSFLVNFSMSHFVVFRPRPASDARSRT